MLMTDRYPPPPFGEVLPGSFVYLGWSVDPKRVGPFVRGSAARDREQMRLQVVATGLARRADVLAVHLFRATFIVPVDGVPLHDLVMLIRVPDGAAAAEVLGAETLRATKPLVAFVARNGARFGLTEDESPRPNILLNHFTGLGGEDDAIDAWRALSAWFGAKTGIDNSTLLVPEPSAPYVLVNYARIPGAVPAFMARQLLRPSFYRYVRTLLARQRLTSLPIFVRPVDHKGS
jgi:hypothetical protein